jgi:hypothetical protein
MNHIVLLGDSIFDNKHYVDGGLDVVTHLRQQLPAGWKATLRAVDGSVAENVHSQILNLPDDATHLIVSAGGGKIATVITCLVNEHDFENKRTEVYF